MGKPKKRRFIQRSFDGKDLPDGLRDPVGAKALIEVLYNLNGELAPGGWDQPPVLGFIYQRGQAREGSVSMRYLEWSPLPDFDKAYHRANDRYGRPHPAIVETADVMRPFIEADPAMVPRSLLAAVLVTEAWALYGNKDTDLAEQERITRERRVHEQADRVEIRMLHAVDTMGVRYSLLQPRDGVPRHDVTDPFNPDRKAGVSGDVVDALHYFTAVCSGQKPLPWKQFREQFEDGYDALMRGEPPAAETA